MRMKTLYRINPTLSKCGITLLRFILNPFVLAELQARTQNVSDAPTPKQLAARRKAWQQTVR